MNRRRVSLFCPAIMLVLAIASDPVSSFGAESTDVSIGAKPVHIIVGMPPGGGVDAYARLVQRHLPRHLRYEPTVVVQNVPGAGSLRSVMALANSWQDPEPSIGTFSSSLLTEAVTDPDRVKIDFRDFAFLGNVAEDSRVCFVSARTGIERLEDLKSRGPLNFGATAPGTSGNLDTAMLSKLLGVRLNLILGYPGSAEKRLAMERGEIDGDCAGATSLPEGWVKSRKINVLVRFSPTPSPGIDATVPFGGALVADEETRRVYDFLVTPQQLGRLFIVSRKLPRAAIERLREGFDATIRDPQFVADANSLGLLVTPTAGEEVDRRVAAIYAASPALIARAKSIAGE